MRIERKVNSSQKEKKAIWTAVFIQWRHWRPRNEPGRAAERWKIRKQDRRVRKMSLKEKIKQLSRKKIPWIAILTISNTATLMYSNHLHHLYHQQTNERMKQMEVQETEFVSILHERVDLGMERIANIQKQMNQVFECLDFANQILEDFQALAEREIKNPVQYRETVQDFSVAVLPALYRIEDVLPQEVDKIKVIADYLGVNIECFYESSRVAERNHKK